MNYMDVIAKGCEILACLFLGVLAVIVLWKIVTDKIDLEYLISEDNGHASMARFQLLIFTFVVAISFVKLVEATDKLPDINSGVLTLLGISASTYAVGKGIQMSGDEQQPLAPNTPKPTPSAASAGKTEAAQPTRAGTTDKAEAGTAI
jgi:hypothetical protein